MELKKYKLGDIADIINGVAFQPSDICNEGVRILRGGNIQSKRIIIKDDDVFLPLCYTNEENQVKIGDTILVASTGSVEVLGKAATCFDEMKNTQIGAFLRIIRPKEERYSMLISIALNSEYFAKYIKAQARGTSINNITIGYLKEFEIYYPKNYLPICDFYQTLEKKIALNRAINDNLEAMAKQLYDYWFVQFDFPNEEGKPYKSSGGKMSWNEKLKREIPEGWNVKSIFNELSVQYGYPFSTDQFAEEQTNVPVVRIRDILDNSISAYSYEDTDDKYRLNEGDLLVGMDGNFHMNYWIDNAAYLNQRSIRLRATELSTVSVVQARYDIAPYIKAKELRAKGSTVGHLSDKDLKELYVIVGTSNKLRDAFNSLLNRIIANRKENLLLIKQRDDLLPLLMNGQVSVNYHLSDD